ncbi:hypothetical protein [Pseudonocardia sp. 73-21]|uniref:hypothetical protein n=1 Tax=Pseudonocardia sp. 73-21 TaxID=1895809 RepID=UPI000964965A|nr:hypothetical protein [Pseudonocardia sp. 73-21]OJY45736.1 MAG: hypothetical protein BGP03_19835 [Pseudonocardia sp. 73-21]
MNALIAQAPGIGCTFDLGCQTGQALRSGFGVLVAEIAKGTAEFVVAATAWWTTTSSVNPADPAVTSAQQMTRPLILAIMVGSVLVQSIRIMISRKGEPLVMVVTGLLRYAIVSALGLVVLQAALSAGDALAQDVLHGAAGNFASLMYTMLTATPTNLWATLVLSGIAGLLGIIQWVLMALRQAGLLVLAAMLPLAASGSLSRSTRGWLDRLMGWLIAIVVYKPAAAFVYYIGFSYLSTRSSKPGDIATLLTGLLVLGLAVVAMPVLLKFFSWSGTALGGSGGGGSGLLAATGAVTMARGSRVGSDRTTAMDTTGPGTGPPGAAPNAGRATTAAAAAAGGPAAGAVAAAAAVAAAGRGAAGRMAGGPPPGGGPG